MAAKSLIPKRLAQSLAAISSLVLASCGAANSTSLAAPLESGITIELPHGWHLESVTDQRDQEAEIRLLVYASDDNQQDVQLTRQRGRGLALGTLKNAMMSWSPTDVEVDGRPAVTFSNGDRTYLFWEPTGEDVVDALFSLSSLVWDYETLQHIAATVAYDPARDPAFGYYEDPGSAEEQSE